MEADEAVHVGAGPSAESYLRQDVILDYCKELGVDGIHPGYGFLSENPVFARKVSEAGITFIGPSPEAMDLMGDKLTAKQAVKEYSVPLVPGIFSTSGAQITAATGLLNNHNAYFISTDLDTSRIPVISLFLALCL